MEDKKILPINLKGLEQKGILPGVSCELDLDLYGKIQMIPSIKDGFHFIVNEIDHEAEIGSKYSERKFVQKQLSSFTLEKQCFYYQIGFDTGSLVEEVLESLPASSSLMVIEPNPELFYTVAAVRDISNILKHPRFHIILVKTKEDASKLSHAIFVTQLPYYQKVQLLERDAPLMHPKYDIVEWDRNIKSDIKNSLKMTEMLINTIDLSTKNYLSNIIPGVCYMDWEGARAQLEGKPLVLIGMGPSLELEWERLKEIQEYVHIGVVDHGLRPALEHGLEPDIVFAVDWQKRTEEFYRDLEIPKKTILVTLFGMWPGSLRLWKGQKLLMPSHQLISVIGELYPRGSEVFIGNNVGQLAVSFSLQTGVSSVYLVGYDLGYPNAITRHPQAMHLNEVYSGSSRFWSIEDFEYLYIRHSNQTIKKNDDEGKVFYTCISLESGRREIEDLLISRSKSDIFYNTCEDATPIKGVEYRALETESFLSMEKKVELQLKSNTLDPEQFVSMCKKKLTQTKKYYSLLEDIFNSATDLKKAFDKNDEPHKLEFFKKAYGHTTKELHGASEVAWVENFLVELDRRIIIHVKSDEFNRDTAEGESERVLETAKLVIRNYPFIKSFKNVLIELFNDLIRRTPEEVRQISKEAVR